jgi:menaquinol-cytochrome c reductase iron-sulfur subunit
MGEGAKCRCCMAGQEAGERSRVSLAPHFFAKLCIGLSGVCAVILGVPLVGFIVAPLFRKTPEAWVPLGKTGGLSRLARRSTSRFDRFFAAPLGRHHREERRVAAPRIATEFIAFSVNCTHLGCPVRWLADAELFMCPCHGGVYYKDGTVAAGPPPHPLTRYQVRVVNDEVQLKTAAIPITTTL